MPVAMPLQGKISQGSTKSKKYKTLISDLGGSYTQRAADSINSNISQWSIKWITVDSADRTTIQTALDTVEGYDYLTWTAPGDTVEKKWRIVSDVSEAPRSGELYDITVNVQETFDLP